MGKYGNNSSREYELLREAFFTDSEKQQYEKVMEDPKEREINTRLQNKQAIELYKKATLLIEMAEKGLLDEEEMERAEYIIAHCLAALDDVCLEIIKEKDDEIER